jgi:hypothetical protein
MMEAHTRLAAVCVGALAMTATIAARADCNGRTDVELSGLNMTVYLDECKTQALIGAITAGAGAAGICAVISSAGAGVAAVSWPEC